MNKILCQRRSYGIILLCISILLVPAVSVGAEEKLQYDAAALPDPFVPLVSEAGLYIGSVQLIDSLTDIVLEGIVWDPEGEPICIINGTILKKGDEIGGATIAEINRTSILIVIGGSSYTIELREE